MRYILSLVFVAAAVSALPFSKDKRRLALQNPDLFQGDILGIDPHDRNVIPLKYKRWTNAKIPYVLHSTVAHKMAHIKDAMKHYHKNTCIQFVERTTEKNYIKIFAGDGCYSYVGMTRGEQPVSLGSGCYSKGTIVHELGHALGFYHEQNRSDRDTYLNIYWENIEKGLEDQFFLLSPTRNLLLTPFDYDSIMIYGEYAFSKDDKRKTMAAKNGHTLLEPYEKDGLTESDIQRLKEMYNCREHSKLHHIDSFSNIA